MAELPNNILQNVETYNKAQLAYLENLNCFLHTANKAFKDFREAQPANLGDTITFDKPPRFATNDGLVVNFDGVEQRVQRLTIDKAKNVNMAIGSRELTLNVEDYMKRFGRGAIEELAAVIEADIAQVCRTQPYRFFGNGKTPINSFEQLARALELFRNFGAARHNTKGYLEDVSVSAITNSGLNQFVPRRNEELANSWELGDFSQCEWYKSNLLPVHIAGTEGEQDTTLTVDSVTKDSDGAVTAITFSGTNASNDADSVKQFDRFEFQDNVSGQPNLRYLTFIGHQVSANPVQFQATSDAASDGSNKVTVEVSPKLQATAGRDQNLNHEIVAGMQAKALPSHRVGMIQSGDQFYLAMPQLPDQDPYKTSVVTDDDTGASLRMYTGAVFGQNIHGTVIDAIWGKTLVPDNGMALIFPL